jgi:hypothetical protein
LRHYRLESRGRENPIGSFSPRGLVRVTFKESAARAGIVHERSEADALTCGELAEATERTKDF